MVVCLWRIQHSAKDGEMPPVVAIVGNSDSGKTTVAASLVSSLSSQGYRVAAVKHCPHGHESGPANSDTERLYQAGAAAVIASSPDRLTRVARVASDSPLESIVSCMAGDMDLVIAEGFKTSAVPKVLVHAGSSSPPRVENVIATVTDGSGPGDAPTYGFDSLDLLTRQLRSQFLDS